MRVCDLFGMISPHPSATALTSSSAAPRSARGVRAGSTASYYGYPEDLLGEVTASFARHGVPIGSDNVSLVKGLFQDSIEIDEPVALAARARSATGVAT
jgi:hypothetical protein